MVLSLAVLFLIAYIGFLYWFIKYHYLPGWVAVVPAGSAPSRYRLARTVRMLLSFIHFFTFLAVLVWLPASLILFLSAQGKPDWGTEVSILSGFRLDLSQVPGAEASGLVDQTLSGRLTMQVDFLNGPQWLIFALATVVQGILGVFVIRQLRNIFAELSNGTPFRTANERRLRRIGIVLLVAYGVQPFWQFFMWGAVINGIDVDPDVLLLQAPFDFNGTALLLGLGLIAFSGAMREGEELESENRLTI